MEATFWANELWKKALKCMAPERRNIGRPKTEKEENQKSYKSYKTKNTFYLKLNVKILR